MLTHLVFVAIGLFTNGTTGETAQAVAQVESVTECAQVINEARTPQQDAEGNTWYLTEGTCRAFNVDEQGNPVSESSLENQSTTETSRTVHYTGQKHHHDHDDHRGAAD